MGLCRRVAVTLIGFTLSCLIAQWGWTYEIRGKIGIAQPYPTVKEIRVRKKVHDACKDVQDSQSLIVSSDGFVKNAVISLKGKFSNPRRGVALQPQVDQSKCRFDPHVLLVPKGQPFLVSNSDPMGHDVRLFDGAKMLFRFEMDASDKPVAKAIDQPGTYVLRCGLHPWMHAFVVSTDHAYYDASDEEGGFWLRDVPEGKGVLNIWHETLGEVDIPIEIKGSMYDFVYLFKSERIMK